MLTMATYVAGDYVDDVATTNGRTAAAVAMRRHAGACGPGVGCNVVHVDFVVVLFVGVSARPGGDCPQFAIGFHTLKVMDFNTRTRSLAFAPRFGYRVVNARRLVLAAPADENDLAVHHDGARLVSFHQLAGNNGCLAPRAVQG